MQCLFLWHITACVQELRELLAQNWIYRTKLARHHLEERARRNIKNELIRLEAKLEDHLPQDGSGSKAKVVSVQQSSPRSQQSPKSPGGLDYSVTYI